MKRAVRIANASGFLGDRASALQEVVQGGEIDFVTGDYLAEVTMTILARQRRKDPRAGYAASFLRHVEPVLAEILARGIKVVVNAGGLDPAGLADAVRALGARLGVSPAIATIHGDDLAPRLAELVAAGHDLSNLETGEPLSKDPAAVFTANAYLGAWGIVRALQAGADIVVCPRVTDASLTVGPAAFWHGWGREDWDRLAGAVVAGHVLECGPQATGGNYSSFREIADLRRPGFPIAEVADDGSSVITKHPGTGGAVTVGTVTAQIVYEIGSPRYLNPDVTARFDTTVLTQVGDDRVAIAQTLGEPPPPTTKVAITRSGGFRNDFTFVLTGLDIGEKAELLESAAREALAGANAVVAFQRIGAPSPDATRQDEASMFLRIAASSPDEQAVGRALSGSLVELALSSYPGLFGTAPPAGAREVALLWPALFPQSALDHHVTLPDGTIERIAAPATTQPTVETQADEPPTRTLAGPRRCVPLGSIADARSGDKGSDANVGVWVRDERVYDFLRAQLTVERLRELLPEVGTLPIERYSLPNLLALNFVIHGLMPGGAGATLRFDRQAKALAEFLRSRPFDVPEVLLAPSGRP